MITQIDRDRKQAEYQPTEWLARRLSECEWELVNKATGALLTFTVAFGRIFGCTSDASGTYYDMPAGACCCRDAEYRALEAGRMCRHAAAWDHLAFELDAQRDAANFRAGSLNPQKFDERVAAVESLTRTAAVPTIERVAA